MPPKRPADQPHERRRRQNVEAQRAYRARQKARVQTLEQMVLSNFANRDPTAVTQLALASTASTASSISGPVSLDSSEAKEIIELRLQISKEELAKCLRIMAKENFSLRDIVKYGLISLEHAMDPALFDKALYVPAQSWINIVKETYPGLNITSVVSAGVRLLSRMQNPPTWPSLPEYQNQYPSLSQGTIHLSTISYFSAKALIVQQLGLKPEALMAWDSQSPFYTMNDDDSGPILVHGGSLRHVAPDLLPTVLQKTMPHHPYIDLIPFPTLRTNVIRAVSMKPPLIDEDDFCLDMMNGGMRCWGSMLGSMHGKGEGMPWDARSWEVMPWFLAKWKPLLGGEDGEIWRTSAWWRALQGVDFNQGLAQSPPPRAFVC